MCWRCGVVWCMCSCTSDIICFKKTWLFSTNSWVSRSPYPINNCTSCNALYNDQESKNITSRAIRTIRSLDRTYCLSLITWCKTYGTYFQSCKDVCYIRCERNKFSFLGQHFQIRFLSHMNWMRISIRFALRTTLTWLLHVTNNVIWLWHTLFFFSSTCHI